MSDATALTPVITNWRRFKRALRTRTAAPLGPWLDGADSLLASHLQSSVTFIELKAPLFFLLLPSLSAQTPEQTR